jgi:hypothetical protein
MTDPKMPTSLDAEDAREADDVGEKPDLGRTADQLNAGLTGSNLGSDTRSGSLRGGSASGSDIDPDQDQIDAALASEGMASAPSEPAAPPSRETVNNTGDDLSSTDDGDDADAATG